MIQLTRSDVFGDAYTLPGKVTGATIEACDKVSIASALRILFEKHFQSCPIGKHPFANPGGVTRRGAERRKMSRGGAGRSSEICHIRLSL